MELKKELAKGVEVELKNGDVILTAKLGVLAIPAINAFMADVESGKIDLIKNTDLDKAVLLKAAEAIKGYLV